MDAFGFFVLGEAGGPKSDQCGAFKAAEPQGGRGGARELRGSSPAL